MLDFRRDAIGVGREGEGRKHGDEQKRGQKNKGYAKGHGSYLWL